MHSMDKSSILYIVKTLPKRPDKGAFKRVFADNLFEARIDTNFSQAQVGECIDMSGNSYAKYEQANSMLPLAYWEAVCEKLYISPWQLLTGRPHGATKPLPARYRNTPEGKVRARELRNSKAVTAKVKKTRKKY